MQSIYPLTDSIALGRNRWALALLADLAAHNGARFVELLHRLNLSRDSLTRTLQAARDAGWVMPNLGHGHPLRPEYILTQEGKRLAITASTIVRTQMDLEIPATALTRWSLPLLIVIDQGHVRFNAIARALPDATPRALSQSLRGLSDVHLTRRDMIDDYPPITHYSLTQAGHCLACAALSPA
jgi:DNA-binding HxlR family transcriptional regulator